MESVQPKTIEDLSKILERNNLYANGKNIPIEFLYETVARSRWDRENIWGIYLTQPSYAWMGLWIAVTSRANLKKRHIQYISPKENDHIGSIKIYNPDKTPLKQLLCNKAYLYLFEIYPSENLEIVNGINNPDLMRDSFRCEKISKKEIIQDCFKPKFKNKALIILDQWQAVLVNCEKAIPAKEIILSEDLITQLSKRISFTDKEIGQDYIKS